MRKVGVRRVWNKMNDKFGLSIKVGQKHNVFELLEVSVDEFNDGEYEGRPQDMLRVVEDRLDYYFDTQSDLAASVIVDECFGR